MFLYTRIKLKRTSSSQNIPFFFRELNAAFAIHSISTSSIIHQRVYCSFLSAIAHHSGPESNDHRTSLNNLSSSFYTSVLHSCIAQKAIKHGKQAHGQLCISGRGSNITYATKLVNLYAVCGDLTYGHRLFDKLPKRNLFLWNVLIRGYAWTGPYEAAVSLYQEMLDHGLKPDNFTFPFVLKACSALADIRVGKDIHEMVVQTGWDKDVFVGAALIDMYSKCGCVRSAWEVFDKIVIRDVVVWNSMLSAYAQNGLPDETLSLYSDMVIAGVRPTEATLVTVISAAADNATLPQGREIHGLSLRQEFGWNDKVKTALVDMYAKCGSLRVARSLFEKLQAKRVVSWNAMITGYAMHGHTSEAITLFEEMRKQIQPDHITFVGVLSACRHGRLLDEGWKYFDELKEYNIDPTVQHYTCMVDLLGHSGRLGDAHNLIMQMKTMPDAAVWGSLLNACKIHGNVELAELAVERLVELEPDDGGHFVILSNIYAQAGKWDGVAKVRKMMMDNGIKKSLASSWIEVKNKVHAFLSGDTSHSMSDAIYAELDRVTRLITKAGYVPNTGTVFHDVDDDEKAEMVCHHSERLAIAFGLISTIPGTRLLITKNLRVCEDCHVAIKYISQVTNREISVRDVNRYHHFKEGSCSCDDHW